MTIPSGQPVEVWGRWLAGSLNGSSMRPSSGASVRLLAWGQRVTPGWC